MLSFPAISTCSSRFLELGNDFELRFLSVFSLAFKGQSKKTLNSHLRILMLSVRKHINTWLSSQDISMRAQVRFVVASLEDTMDIWQATQARVRVTTLYKHLAKLEKHRLVNFFQPFHKIREWSKVIVTG